MVKKLRGAALKSKIRKEELIRGLSNNTDNDAQNGDSSIVINVDHNVQGITLANAPPTVEAARVNNENSTTSNYNFNLKTKRLRGNAAKFAKESKNKKDMNKVSTTKSHNDNRSSSNGPHNKTKPAEKGLIVDNCNISDSQKIMPPPKNS